MTTTSTETVKANELATLLAVDTSTVYRHVKLGNIPAPLEFTRPMLFARGAVESIDVADFKRKFARVPRARRVRQPQAVSETPKATELPTETAPEVEAEMPRFSHQLFPKLLYYVRRRRNTYLHGPMGSGKSTAAEQAARALGLRYAYVSLNPQSPASLLTGFLDAHGRFSSPEFYRCYTQGGVFCIDELDNASASLLTLLNSALANGHAAFPNGMAARHADFVLVATGNTTGRGGDWQYPERRKIDEATLDRLTFIEWGYDLKLEKKIALSINSGAQFWIDWVRSVRSFVARRENGIRGGVYATPRAIFAGAEDLLHRDEHGLSIEEIATSTVFKGLDSDTVTRIVHACPLPAEPAAIAATA